MVRIFSKTVFNAIPSTALYDAEAEGMVTFLNGGWVCIEGCQDGDGLSEDNAPESLKAAAPDPEEKDQAAPDPAMGAKESNTNEDSDLAKAAPQPQGRRPRRAPPRK